MKPSFVPSLVQKCHTTGINLACLLSTQFAIWLDCRQGAGMFLLLTTFAHSRFSVWLSILSRFMWLTVVSALGADPETLC